MKSRRIYSPNNVWLLTFNGLSSDPDAEPVSLVYYTRSAALVDFAKIVEELKKKYPGHIWFEDIDKLDSTKKIAFRLESTSDPRVMVTASRIRFLEGSLFWRNINQDDITLFAKGVNI